MVVAKSFLLCGGLVENAWGFKILLSYGHHIISFFLLLKQFAHPCGNDLHIHLFTKILGEKLGYNNDYKNADFGI
jgi:hypothetical protein